MSRFVVRSYSSRRVSVAVAAAPVVIGCLLALAGCGGAGSSSGALNGPGTAYNTNNAAIAGGAAQADAKAKAAQLASAGEGRVAVFVTQTGDGAPSYDHVWATIHKVELIGTDEKADTLWNDEEGRTVDLVALTNGKSALLAVGAATPARLYGRVRVTLGKSFQLFERGAQTGTMTPVAPGIATGEAGRPVVTFPLFKSRALAGAGGAKVDTSKGGEDIALAFDLGKFTWGKTVTPVIVEGDKQAVATASEASKQSPARFVGTVTQIASGGAGASGDDAAKTASAAATPAAVAGRTFLLTLGSGKAVIAETRPETAVYNATEAASPRLADEAQVAVWGIWDARARRVVASDVIVYEGGKKAASVAQGAEIVRGRVEGAVGDGGVFSVSAQSVEGFLPTKAIVAVTPGKNVTFRTRGGLPLTAREARTALGLAGAKATIEGDYDPVAARLTARRIKIETAAEYASTSAPDAHEALAVGTLASAGPNIADQFALVSLSEWDGWASPLPRGNGETADKNDKPDAKASPADANADANKKAKPAPGDNGALVNVAVTDRTLFRDEKGGPLDREAFFRFVEANDRRAARVRGTLGADGKLTAMSVELRPAAVQSISRSNGDDASGSGAKGDAGQQTGR